MAEETRNPQGLTETERQELARLETLYFIRKGLIK